MAVRKCFFVDLSQGDFIKNQFETAPFYFSLIPRLVKRNIVVQKLDLAASFAHKLNYILHLSRRTKLCRRVSYKPVNNTAVMSESRLVFPKKLRNVAVKLLVEGIYHSRTYLSVFILDRRFK